jgi:hypothetical protein
VVSYSYCPSWASKGYFLRWSKLAQRLPKDGILFKMVKKGLVGVKIMSCLFVLYSYLGHSAKVMNCFHFSHYLV